MNKKNHIHRLNLRVRFGIVFIIGLLLAGLPLISQQDKENNDTVIQAMKDEMDRSIKNLKIENMDTPYFIEYSIIDHLGYLIEGHMGALIESNETHKRLLKVNVRVGDYQLDNTGFMGRDSLLSFRGDDSTDLVLENDYNSIRRSLWLATDSSYKQALEQLAGKKAFLKNQAQPEVIPDFSKEQPVQKLIPYISFKFDRSLWEKNIKELSAIFRNFPTIDESSVQMKVIVDNKYYMNSEGTISRYPVPLISLIITASMQAPDGMKLKHYIPYYVKTIDQLPDRNKVMADIQKMAEELTALAGAPVVDNYIGPVLFTGQASAELFTQVLVPNLSGQRPPQSDIPQLAALEQTSKLVSRLNRKVLPSEISVVDDPTKKNFENTPLIGTYGIDDEGVVPGVLNLVDKGNLKSLLMSRKPRKEFAGSNGHGRSTLEGSVGTTIGNLIVSTTEGKTYEQLKEELIQACKSQNIPFGLIIKSLDNPSLTGVDLSTSLFSSFQGGASKEKITTPLLMYRVNVADGKEELIRGLAFSEFPVNKLQDIASVGNDYYVLNREMSPSGSGGFGGLVFLLGVRSKQAMMAVPTSIVAPSVLFEELELKKSDDNLKKLPLVPAPPISK